MGNGILTPLVIISELLKKKKTRVALWWVSHKVAHIDVTEDLEPPTANEPGILLSCFLLHSLEDEHRAEGDNRGHSAEHRDYQFV